MSFDLSSLMPLLAIVVSVGAVFFWDGNGDKGDRVEKFIESKVFVGSGQGHVDTTARLVRIEIEPGDRLKSTDLRARDKREEAVSA